MTSPAPSWYSCVRMAETKKAFTQQEGRGSCAKANWTRSSDVHNAPSGDAGSNRTVVACGEDVWGNT
jgi:hypothetical protein